MRIRLVHVLGLFVLIIILQMIGEYAGLLDPSREIIWYDNIMHALAGMLSGIFTVWGIQREGRNIKGWKLALAIISVTIMMAVLWELFELAAFQIMRDYELTTKPYSTNIIEATVDSLSNLLGGIIAAVIVISSDRKNQ